MDITYKVRGADGIEYGPATLEQVTGWVREGRIQSTHNLQRSDMQHWAAAGNFTELSDAFGAAVPPALPPARPEIPDGGEMAAATLGRVRASASWFYWVAGLSLVNSVVAFSGGEWRFLFGLGVTQIFDAIGHGIEGTGKFIALFLDLLAAGALVLFGVFAGKRHTWAFITGMVLLGLDGGIQLLGQDWIGAAFHGYVLFRLFQGMQACRELNSL
ncbi:MAG: hypothetical protein EPO07_04890 [Verrucomicrobia bacterium]|nr:MAG: hypothetical protein EPO07_04890 [Verrucomicrobiota bacterium]